MPFEEERLELERERFAFEQENATRERELSERDFDEQRRTRLWSQLATLVPLVAIVMGFCVNLMLESWKDSTANTNMARKVRREFIDRQLAELYYPVLMRLEKDTAVWTLSKGLVGRQETPSQDPFSAYIERQVLIPNHDEVIKIIDGNFALLKNSDEEYNPEVLIAQIRHYQRHVATFKALRSTATFLNRARQNFCV